MQTPFGTAATPRARPTGSTPSREAVPLPQYTFCLYKQNSTSTSRITHSENQKINDDDGQRQTMREALTQTEIPRAAGRRLRARAAGTLLISPI